MKQRVADYIFKTLANIGVKSVFVITGGGAMHLDDALAKETRIQYICNHHEQACAMAAEGYARISGEMGVICVTTGPGGINALNGVFGAWTDSIPMLIISGQVKRETCMALYPEIPLRQLGDQEADIINMVKGITKYAVLVQDPTTIKFHLNKAIFLAKSGRPGPCWLDIPIDVQSALIDEEYLEEFNPSDLQENWHKGSVSEKINQVINKLTLAERPVILAGTGVRLAGALDIFHSVIRKLQIPVTTAWTHDIIASDDPLYCGRAGTIGDRAGNFTVQNADMLLVLGSRLNIRQISYNWDSFARHAYKIQVDIDEMELKKPTVTPDLPIHCDLKYFLENLDAALAHSPNVPQKHAAWLHWCKERIVRYPVLQPNHRKFTGKINPYLFLHELFQVLDSTDSIVCGNGAACVMTFQSAFIKEGQRLFSNSGAASMGYDLPAAIGAAIAAGPTKRIICLAGDGSIHMNIQELQTVVHHQLPIKIIVLNNGGYLSIRTTQRNFFGQFIGESSTSGVSFPDYTHVAAAYGMPSIKLCEENFTGRLHDALKMDGPVLIEVVLDPAQSFEPKLSSRQLSNGKMVSPALEDMAPFLDADELKQNLFIYDSENER